MPLYLGIEWYRSHGTWCPVRNMAKVEGWVRYVYYYYVKVGFNSRLIPLARDYTTAGCSSGRADRLLLSTAASDYLLIRVVDCCKYRCSIYYTRYLLLHTSSKYIPGT